jgi:large-conductance mechanosensitive channel
MVFPVVVTPIPFTTNIAAFIGFIVIAVIIWFVISLLFNWIRRATAPKEYIVVQRSYSATD